MPLPEIDRSVELCSRPGHDRECARAMLSQARLRARPLDDLQVAHLLVIGYRAGVAAGRTAAAAPLRAAANGRREYRKDIPDGQHADALDQEARMLDLAADVAEGDLGPLYGWLPSWRWTAEMNARLHAEGTETDAG